jgi:hypothetical protein
MRRVVVPQPFCSRTFGSLVPVAVYPSLSISSVSAGPLPQLKVSGTARTGHAACGTSVRKEDMEHEKNDRNDSLPPTSQQRESPRPVQPDRGSVVKTGGIAGSDADTEDVSRDTYGFTEPEPRAATREERFAEAEQAAAAAGIPGITRPEDTSAEDEPQARGDAAERDPAQDDDSE